MDAARGAAQTAGPLRLLWLIDSLTLGGAESLARSFARGLDHERVAFQVACLKTIGGNPLEPELRSEGVTLSHLGSRGLRDAFAFVRLVRLLRSQRIEIVHAHLTDASIWAPLAASLAGAACVATLHVAPAAAGSPWRRRVLRWALRRATRVVAVSDWVRSAWAERALLDRDRMVVVRNGVECGSSVPVERRALGLPDGLLVTTVSALRPGKGVDVLLRAAARLPEVSLAIAGDGPESPALQALATELGLGARVLWLGARRDVRRLMAAGDVFALASVEDAFPTVLLEAMAEGRAVVATRSGGIPEIVDDGRTGLLVPPQDPAALAEALATLLGDAAGARALGEAGRRRVCERFSTRDWCARLEALYREAAARR